LVDIIYLLNVALQLINLSAVIRGYYVGVGSPGICAYDHASVINYAHYGGASADTIRLQKSILGKAFISVERK